MSATWGEEPESVASLRGASVPKVGLIRIKDLSLLRSLISFNYRYIDPPASVTDECQSNISVSQLLRSASGRYMGRG